MNLFYRFFLFLSLVGAICGICFGQTQITTGVIQGTVLDPSGAVIAGADVVANNLETGTQATQQTDSDGRFVLLSLPPGRYAVTVTKSGFGKFVQKDVELTVGQAISTTDDEGIFSGRNGGSSRNTDNRYLKDGIQHHAQ